MNLNAYTYTYTPGLWVITPYYNPMGYKTRRQNYDIFMHLMHESGIPVITVECAFNDQSYDLPDALDIIKVRGSSLLWQKERLINLAIPWLPASCKGVVWADCDIIFTDPNWAKKTMSALDESPIVQLFETCDRLPQNHNLISNETDMCTSFAKMVCDNPDVLKSGQYHDHGHPGYVWAARKDILDKHGLYEFAIAGAADHYIAHASMNDMHSPCIHKSMFGCEAPWQDWLAWADSFHTSVQGKLGVVPGKILHLWHGDLVNRKYYLRYLELAEFNFNPYTDLIAPPGRPLEFKPGKPEMEAWFNSYFKSRLEDGDAHNQNETGGYAHG